MNSFHALASVLGKNLFQKVTHTKDFLCCDLQIGHLAVADLAIWLMEKDTAMRQSKTLSLGAGGQKNGGRRGSLTEANGGNVVLDELHRVVNSKQ